MLPFGPGGVADVTARILADKLTEKLGQQVVVDNKPGAAGTLGAAAMVGASPEGYVLTQVPISVLRLPHMEKTPYDPLTDLTYIAGISGYTFGVVVRSDAPWKSWSEYLAYAKANPEKISYGTSYGTPGAGTSLHITMEEIAYKQGIKWLHVPHKGNAPSMTALLGGHIDSAADSTGWGPFVDAGKMRLLVTWGERRSKRWPDTPTLKELGFGIVSNSPYGIAGPKGMDPKVVKILHDAFKKGMEDPIHTSVLEKYDQELWYVATEDYARYARETFAAEKSTMDRMKAQSK